MTQPLRTQWHGSNPFGDANPSATLREMRLWHWRQMLQHRALAKLGPRDVAAGFDESANRHMRFVQALNDAFPVPERLRRLRDAARPVDPLRALRTHHAAEYQPFWACEATARHVLRRRRVPQESGDKRCPRRNPDDVCDSVASDP
jgi:hypothetical protein